jgi:hypothetical protein
VLPLHLLRALLSGTAVDIVSYSVTNRLPTVIIAVISAVLEGAKHVVRSAQSRTAVRISNAQMNVRRWCQTKKRYQNGYLLPVS